MECHCARAATKKRSMAQEIIRLLDPPPEERIHPARQAEHPKAAGEHEGGEQADGPSHAGDDVTDGGQLSPRGQTGDGFAFRGR